VRRAIVCGLLWSLIADTRSSRNRVRLAVASAWCDCISSEPLPVRTNSPALEGRRGKSPAAAAPRAWSFTGCTNSPALSRLCWGPRRVAASVRGDSNLRLNLHRKVGRSAVPSVLEPVGKPLNFHCSRSRTEWRLQQ